MLFPQSASQDESAAGTPEVMTNGLHGRVKSLTEITQNSRPNPDGGTFEYSYEFTMEYDFNGRVAVMTQHDSGGRVGTTRYEYNPAGQLLKTHSETQGQPATETDYTYDGQGRLLKIANGDNSPPTSFRYDEQGRKTMTVIQRAEDYRPNTATGADSPFAAAMLPPNLPGGGSSTTIFDEHDRPTEVQVRDAEGHLASHAIRQYDSAGHISEEKQVHDDLMAGFPSEVKTQMLEQSGLTPDQLRQELQSQFKQLLNGNSDSYSTFYRYDSQGRKIHTSRRMFNLGDEIDTTYNDHGDVASEITRATRPAANSADNAGSVDSYSEARYSYEYDSYGNWTEKTTSSRSAPDAGFEPSTMVKRSITYY